MIKFDKSKATGGFTVIPEGSYECIIESGVTKKASTGTEYIDFKLKVRDDVEGQAYGGRVLFGKVFNTEASQGVLMGFIDALDAPDGTEFPSMEALKDFAVGKAILAKVKIGTYQGKERNEVSYMNASKVGGGRVDSPFDNPVGNDPFASGDGPIEISDSDLPF